MTRAILIAAGFVLGAVAAATVSTASAEYISIKKTAFAATDLTDTAINTAAWTGWKCDSERAGIVFEIDYTFSAGTDIVMACETSDDPNTANDAGFELTILFDSGTDGTSNTVQHKWRDERDASGKWTWQSGTLPHPCINCSFVRTGGNANDKATVRWSVYSP